MRSSLDPDLLPKPTSNETYFFPSSLSCRTLSPSFPLLARRTTLLVRACPWRTRTTTTTRLRRRTGRSGCMCWEQDRWRDWCGPTGRRLRPGSWVSSPGAWEWKLALEPSLTFGSSLDLVSSSLEGSEHDARGVGGRGGRDETVRDVHLSRSWTANFPVHVGPVADTASSYPNLLNRRDIYYKDPQLFRSQGVVDRVGATPLDLEPLLRA